MLSKRLLIDLLAMILLAVGVILGLTVILHLFGASLEGMLLIAITVVGGTGMNGIVDCA